jgi:hypothetical protein
VVIVSVAFPTIVVIISPTLLVVIISPTLLVVIIAPTLRFSSFSPRWRVISSPYRVDSSLVVISAVESPIVGMFTSNLPWHRHQSSGMEYF